MNTASQAPSEPTSQEVTPQEATSQEAAPQDATSASSPGGRVYRGRCVEELIPRIQADLGHEAIVLRRRNGLQGGIGGFFQRPFVEIEARAGSGHIDLYDGGVETPTPLVEPTPAPLAEPTHDDFAEVLAAAGIAITDARPSPSAPDTAPAFSIPATERTPATAEPALTAQAQATPKASRSKTSRALAAKLVATGIDEQFADQLIDAATAHVLAFNPRIGLRQAVQIELQRRVPTAPPLPADGAVIAFVGPGGSGKTRCVASLAAIYERGPLQVACASILAHPTDGVPQMALSPGLASPVDAGSAKALRALASARSKGLALLDTPSVSAAEQGQVRMLAKLLDAIKPDRVVVTLPATLGAKACSQLLQSLRLLKPHALAITHADETDQLGVAAQAACESGLAAEYLLTGSRERALGLLDPVALTARLLR